VKMILRELQSICDKAPSRGELQKAKDYTVGQTLMGLESTTNQMMWVGESMIGYGAIQDPCEMEARIHAVQPEDVQRCACYCLHKGRLGLALVGPVKERERIESWLS
jgi:predicted Zn-dependent peptidase